MARAIRTHLTYANVMATIAVFGVLGGTAWAITANSVGSRQIKKGGVRSSDIAPNAVTSPNVADGSLLGADFAAGQLPAGPAGPTGPPGENGSPDTEQQVLDKLKAVDTDASGLNADTVDGMNAGELAAGRIHAVGTSQGEQPLLPGLNYTLGCSAGYPGHPQDEAIVRFWHPPGTPGSANAMVVAKGVETPFVGGFEFNVTNGAAMDGYPVDGYVPVWVLMSNDSGEASAEIQLIIDIGPRTYSIALHLYERESDGYCEAIGTATLGQ